MRADSRPLDRCLQSILARLPAGERRSLTWRGQQPRESFDLQGMDSGRVLAVSLDDGTWRVSLDGQLVRETSDLKVAADAALKAWIRASEGR